MRKAGVSIIIQQVVIVAIITFLASCGGGGGGGGSDSASTPGGTNNDPASIVTFTYTLDTGLINSVPVDADRVKVVLDGKESTAEITSRIIIHGDSQAVSAESKTLTLSFNVSPGEHAYTVSALKGTTVLEIIGPITFTKENDIPLTTPISFDFPNFDNSQTDIGLDTPNSFIFLGTTGNDRIVQYGGTADDFLSVETNDGNDWIEQYSGGGIDEMIADTGTGNDYIYQEGGAGNDAIRVSTGYGDDTVIIDAGPGDDTITYDVDYGTDNVSIEGGEGTDTLTVNQNGQPVLIQDGSGNVIYQTGSGGITITVVNVEHIAILDKDGNEIWPAP
jgi:hypothetical protein